MYKILIVIKCLRTLLFQTKCKSGIYPNLLSKMFSLSGKIYWANIFLIEHLNFTVSNLTLKTINIDHILTWHSQNFGLGVQNIFAQTTSSKNFILQCMCRRGLQKSDIFWNAFAIPDMPEIQISHCNPRAMIILPIVVSFRQDVSIVRPRKPPEANLPQQLGHDQQAQCQPGSHLHLGHESLGRFDDWGVQGNVERL